MSTVKHAFKTSIGRPRGGCQEAGADVGGQREFPRKRGLNKIRAIYIYYFIL